ncbi:MAG: redox-regulated ATPase YchF [Candidatus Woesearchaeota archaeon]
MLVGVVGKANVGKSTFFKAATLAEVLIANYPFATIKPNHGTGYVRVDCADTFFGVRCKPRFGFCLSGKRFVPVEMLDVAGLVPGAHEGKGMGNQFLDDLRQADVLIHVVDVAGTTSEVGEPVEPGTYDPANDIRFLEKELDYWYLGIFKKGWDKFAREIQQTHQQLAKSLAKQLSALGVTEKMVEGLVKEMGLDATRPTDYSDDTLFQMAHSLRVLTKPMIVACNKIDVAGALDNFARLKKEFPDALMMPCSAESELALREAAKHKLIDYIAGGSDFKIVSASLSERQAAALEFIRSNVLSRFGSTGVQQVLDAAVFGLLSQIAVFPVPDSRLADQAGNVLPDCFLVPNNSTALDFAFRIHTDIGSKFIRAVDMKQKMTVGKDHKLKDGDVIEIVAGK